MANSNIEEDNDPELAKLIEMRIIGKGVIYSIEL